jgi:hypothetical protein
MNSAPKRESQPEPQEGSGSATQSWLLRHIRLALALACLVAVLLLIFVPPFIGISQYKKHITELVSASFGRPARLSSVELRLLPRPGFVLTDLTVDEDPAFGGEPVLHANTVVASIRLLSLWRGKLALDRISVDEASLNLVRTPYGRWNVDSLLRTAGPVPAGGAASGAMRPLPYLEATNSRINIKYGAEKLPFSITGADVSLWQEDGAWRVRLRGHPTRTDIPINPADTGIVRLEATAHPAARLSRMPLDEMRLDRMQIHLDMDWRDAQLGQLSRLILGSDEDWRGDLTGEMHVDGTAEAAKITARLRASGVHRAEFPPAGALDFDANCAFLYRFTARSIENIECGSPIGSGRMSLTGALPAAPQQPCLTLELDRVPAQAPLDLLRTMRGNLDQSLTAEGSLSGTMGYAPEATATTEQESARAPARISSPSASPLKGSFTADSVKISGVGLAEPVTLTKLTLEPGAQEPGTQGPGVREADQLPTLTATASVPAGAPAPLAATAHLALAGFAVTLRGPAALARLRDLAHAAGIAQAGAMSQLSGEPAAVDLRVAGPWIAPADSSLAPAISPDEASKKLSGSIALRNAAWKPDFLAGPVEISSATLRFDGSVARWEQVNFSYGSAANPNANPATDSAASPASSPTAGLASAGPVRGTATITTPLVCDPPGSCTAHFAMHFAALDAASLQASLLGVREPGTLLSTLLDRFRSSPAPTWPPLEGTIDAGSFTAGPFAFTAASAELSVKPAGAKITSFEAQLFGGRIHGTGSLAVSAGQNSQAGKPAYTIEAGFTGVNPALAGELAGVKALGGPLDGSLKLDLAGFTAAELARSAKGEAKFDWPHGEIVDEGPVFARFDRWMGEAQIGGKSGDGKVTLGKNQLRHGAKTSQAEGSLSFDTESNPAPKFSLVSPRR